jgi:quercetin dioxygenase-like cupin family protein
MQIVRSDDARKYENADTCVAFEYETEDPDINIARVEVSGRYPIEGAAKNTLVKELVYVESGSGEVSIDGIPYVIAKGDVVSIEKGEEVFWNGVMTLVIACAPAWTPEQYEHV